MPDMNQKLDRFTAKILAEAADESKRALAEVKRRRELRFQEAEDAALKEAYEYIHGEVARIQSEAGGACPAICWRTSGPSTCAAPRWPRRSFALVRAKIAAFTRHYRLWPAAHCPAGRGAGAALRRGGGAGHPAGRRSELSGGPGRLRAPDPPDLPGGGLPPGAA